MTLSVTIAGVTMTGDAHFVDEGSPSHVNALGQRDTFSCRIVSKDGSYTPAMGAAVEVTDDAGLRFGGSIREKTVSQFGVGVITEIQCASWEQIFDRRYVGQQKSFVDTPAGDVFQYIFDNWLTFENLTASVVAAGPNISVSFDWCTVREALDLIAQQASGATDTYIWDCTPAKVTRFYKQSSFAAPMNVSDASTDVMRPITINQSFGGSGVGYGNKAFIRVSSLITEDRTNTFGPDGVLTSFAFELPLAGVPTITLDTGSGPVAQTVGIRDLDTGKDFYWQDGSPEITAAVAPAAGSTLVVIAKGYQTTVVDAGQNNDEVTARSIAEDNSGWYQVLIDSSASGTYADAVAIGQAWLSKYANGVPRAVEYVTITNGCRAGQNQTINLSGFGETINTTFILESVTMFQAGTEYGWRVRAVNGALANGWLQKLRAIAGSGSGSVAGGGTVISTGNSLALTPALSSGLVGVPYSGPLVATGGEPPYTFSISTGALPAWATLDAATGIISGTPDAVATTGFTARVTDASSVTADADCSLAIADAGVTPNVAAPNVTATCAVTFQPWAHAQEAVFSGVITLPTGHADYSHLKVIEVYGIDPSGDAHFVGRFDSWAGSTITYSGVVGLQPATNETWSARFVAFNERGLPTDPPYELTGISVTAAAVTALAGADVTGSRWTDKGGALHAVMTATISCSQYPMVFRLWIDPQGGRPKRYQGLFTATQAGEVITLGLENSKTIVYPPTAGNESWKLIAAPFDSTQQDDVVPVSAFTSAAFTANAPGTYATTGSSTAAAPTLIDQGGAGGAKQWTIVADFGLPLADPKFFFARVSRVIGKYVSGVWTPLPGQPTYEGVTGTPIGDWAGPTYFRPDAVDHAPVFGLVGAIQSSGTTTVRLTWGPYSYDSEWNVIRLYLYLGTRQDDGSGGTKTQQSTWPGGTAYYEVTLDATKAQTNATLIDSATMGDGWYKDPTGKPKVGTAANPIGLQNPGFEDCPPAVGVTTIAGWKNNGGTYYVEVDPAYVYTGTKSIRITTSPYVGLWQDGFIANPGDVLHAALRARALYVTAGGMVLSIQFLNSAGVVIDQNWVTLPYTSATAAFGVLNLTSVVAPTGTSSARVSLGCSADAAGGWWYVDNVLLQRQTSTGPGTVPDGTGGVKLKIDAAAPVTVDGSGNVTLKLSQGVGTDGSGNLVVKNGQGITFDGSGNVVPNAGPGLTFNAGGALVPNQGATVGVNASGQLIVPSGSLGLTQFGGVYQPYAFYYGLPSAYDASVPKLIINTADWKIYRNTGGAWSKQQDPADLIAGTITALVSMISPSISGGSMVGTSWTMTVGNATITISSTACDGGAGIRITDTGLGTITDIFSNGVRVKTIANANVYSMVLPGSILICNGVTLKTITATS